MAIYDCCTFFNENDLYEIRFKEHWNWVDKFIIVEAGETHTGMPKSFNFDLKRFEQYKEKIVYVTFDNFANEIKKHPELLDHAALADRGPSMVTEDWTRGYFQCNYIWKVLQDIGANDKDIVYLSCPDELLNQTGWNQGISRFQNNSVDYRGFRPTFGFHYYLYAYKMNLLHKHWTIHVSGQMTEVSNFRKLLPATWRYLEIQNCPHIPDAGWHFTFLDPTDGEMVLAKQKSWSHSKDKYQGRKVKFDHITKEEAMTRFWEDYPVTKVPITASTHPSCVVNDIERWDNFIFKKEIN